MKAKIGKKTIKFEKSPWCQPDQKNIDNQQTLMKLWKIHPKAFDQKLTITTKLYDVTMSITFSIEKDEDHFRFSLYNCETTNKNGQKHDYIGSKFEDRVVCFTANCNKQSQSACFVDPNLSELCLVSVTTWNGITTISPNANQTFNIVNVMQSIATVV